MGSYAYGIPIARGETVRATDSFFRTEQRKDSDV